MRVRQPFQTLTARIAAWLRQRGDAPASSGTSLITPRKLPPIEDVVARVGREPFLPD
jgi:hypothetical protein